MVGLPGFWFSRKYVEQLQYNLEPTALRIDQGRMTKKQISIPLSQITDVTLEQSLLMRAFGIWRLEIQTAGSTKAQAEGVLWGLRDPHHVRDTVLAAITDLRDRLPSTCTSDESFQ